jgi:predicted permease
LRRFVLRIYSFIRPERAERELSKEVAAHLALVEDEMLRRGLTLTEARRAARRNFGGVEASKERARDERSFLWLEDARRDAHYAVRSLRRTPGFSIAAMLTLALGIGANTAIFSLINTLILRDLPVREPEQLVELLSANYPGDPRFNSFGWTSYERYVDQNEVFSDLFGMSTTRVQVGRDGLDVGAVDGAYVTGNFFPALGLQAVLGRLLGPGDARLGPTDPSVAVLSWSYWQSRFNLDHEILGRRLIVEGVPVTVVGVTPRAFFGLQVGYHTDLWLPAATEPNLKLMGRLKDGVSIEQAQADMRVLDRVRVEEAARSTGDSLWRDVRLDLVTASAGFSLLRERYATRVLVLMAVVGLLLAITCTGVASMLLARGATRHREMAVRVSLGAARCRLIRQVLTESVLLSAVGGLVGVLLAYAGARTLVRIIASGSPMVGVSGPVDLAIGPDLPVLVFTAGVAALTGILCGLAPAWTAFASTPASSLREAGGVGESSSRRLCGKSLVVAQVALSVVLLSAAGMFIGNLSRLRNVDTGFDRNSVLLMRLNPQGSGYNSAQLTRLYKALLDRLESIPGVRSATLSGTTPIQGPAGSRFATVEGFREDPGARRRLWLNGVAPRYFETIGTPLVAGRDFRFEDEARSRVAIVNQAIVRHYFGVKNPVGKHVTFDGEDTPYEIVGVVADAKYRDLHDAAPRTIYLNAFQEGRIASQFSLRTDVAPASLAGQARRAVDDVLKTVRVAKMTTLAEQVDASLIPERLTATLSGLFGVLGAVLAAVGLFGLLAYTVVRRTNEIGLRMAMGATRREVTTTVLKSALGLVSLGLVVGVPVAIGGGVFAASVVENLPVPSPLPIVFSVTVMVAVALIAAAVPAHRAARVGPMVALRHE